MIATSGWVRDCGIKMLFALGVFLVYLAYLGVVALLMRPTLQAIGPLL